jgi:pyruvate/2-oxoglutarate/acetoin dehydrogenase E1 component
MTYCAQVLNQALHHLFERHPEVYLLGEDLLDPYGGAFKVSAGLSTRFPERVLTTPLSEAAITGLAAGMALRGLRPIVEIMFGDFITLAYDQIVNYAAKFHTMYNRKVTCPLVIRTPMGGRRGYGPTHSQTLEKLLVGVPGMRIVAPSHLHHMGDLLEKAVLENEHPLLFVENKALYAQENTPPQNGRMGDFDAVVSDDLFPTLRLSLNRFEASDLTLVAYGGMAPLVLKAATDLAMEWEIFAEVILPTQISPFEGREMMTSLQRTRRLLVVEEGTLHGGWGAEVSANLAERNDFPYRFARLAALDTVIPSSKVLEDAVLPQVEDIVRIALKMCGS